MEDAQITWELLRKKFGPSKRNLSEFRGTFQPTVLLAAKIEIEDLDPDPEQDDLGWQ